MVIVGCQGFTTAIASNERARSTRPRYIPNVPVMRVPSALVSRIWAMRPASGYGSGSSRTAFTPPKIVVVVPNAQRERQHGDNREHRVAAKRPCGVARVLRERLEKAPTVPVAILFFHLFDAAEVAPRRRPRIARRHAAPPMLRGQFVEMQLNLVVQLAITPPAPKQSGQPRHEFMNCRSHQNLWNLCSYSCLNATTGSTWLARRAGA